MDAHVVVSKYLDHLPLHRMQGIFKRQSTQLSKQTMWDMLVTVAELVAQPILEQARRELLESGVLQSDESPAHTMGFAASPGTALLPKC